jgi:hypothetical protein
MFTCGFRVALRSKPFVCEAVLKTRNPNGNGGA